MLAPRVALTRIVLSDFTVSLLVFATSGGARAAGAWVPQESRSFCGIPPKKNNCGRGTKRVHSPRCTFAPSPCHEPNGRLNRMPGEGAERNSIICDSKRACEIRETL